MAEEYQSPLGRHRHICRECGCVWEHAEVDMADDFACFIAAHTCPRCELAGWIWQYKGPDVPAYHDHHEANGEE